MALQEPLKDPRGKGGQETGRGGSWAWSGTKGPLVAQTLARCRLWVPLAEAAPTPKLL